MIELSGACLKTPKVGRPICTQAKLPFEAKKKLRPPRINWAELLRRTFWEDVPRCPWLHRSLASGFSSRSSACCCRANSPCGSEAIHRASLR